MHPSAKWVRGASGVSLRSELAQLVWLVWVLTAAEARSGGGVRGCGTVSAGFVHAAWNVCVLEELGTGHQLPYGLRWRCLGVLAVPEGPSPRDATPTSAWGRTSVLWRVGFEV